VLERIRHEPAVIFTTAYDRFAVAAFELEALDYLVKPFGRDRLNAALERARRMLPAAPAAPAPSHVADARSEPPTPIRERARTALGGTGPLSRLLCARPWSAGPGAAARGGAPGGRGRLRRPAHGGRRFLVELPAGRLRGAARPAALRAVHRAHIVNLDYRAAVPTTGAAAWSRCATDQDPRQPHASRDLRELAI
jgi:two-component system LytT family response regulator